jgi:hypothetical protein
MAGPTWRLNIQGVVYMRRRYMRAVSSITDTAGGVSSEDGFL